MVRVVILLSAAYAGCASDVEKPLGMQSPTPAQEEPSGPSTEEKTPVNAFSCEPGALLPSPRIWRLSRAQYDNSVKSLWGSTQRFTEELTPEPADTSFPGGAAVLRVRAVEVGQFRKAAGLLAEEASGSRFASVFPCPGRGAEAACRRQFVSGLGAKAFRRPLTTDESTRYETLFQSLMSLRDERLAVKGVVEAMLQSPHFLFRTELGVPQGSIRRLTADEIASALAFSLTNAPPDDQLQEAARNGALFDGATRGQHARRLTQSPAGQAALTSFYRQWLQYGQLASATKDPSVVPNFEALRSELVTETDDLLRELSQAGTFATLLEGDTAFVSPSTAALWQVPAPASRQRVSLAAAKRRGILGTPALMATLATAYRSSIVFRGLFVREELLCEEVPAPDGNIDLTIPDLPAGLSRREQLTRQTAPSQCAGCHSLLNPVGFGLEEFDAAGRLRTKEDNNVPIDATGRITSGDLDAPFEGHIQLSHHLARSSSAQACVSRHMFRFLNGRHEKPVDDCRLQDSHSRFIAAGFKLADLPAFAVEPPHFIERSAQ
jgi:hypothetical protein